MRSIRNSANSTGTLRVMPISGTTISVPYPRKISAQWRPVESEMRPETSRSAYPKNSPKPYSVPTVAALTDSRLKYCPLALRAPS